MTLKGLKEKLVIENKVLDDKQANKLCINTGLFVGILGVTTSLFVSATLDLRFTLIVAVIFGLIFLWVLDVCCESLDFLNKWMKISRLWFLNLVLLAAMFIGLKYFNFIS